MVSDGLQIRDETVGHILIFFVVLRVVTYALNVRSVNEPV